MNFQRSDLVLRQKRAAPYEAFLEYLKTFLWIFLPDDFFGGACLSTEKPPAQCLVRALSGRLVEFTCIQTSSWGELIYVTAQSSKPQVHAHTVLLGAVWLETGGEKLCTHTHTHTPTFGSHYTHVHAHPYHTHMHTHAQHSRSRVAQPETCSATASLPVLWKRSTDVGLWREMNEEVVNM